MIRRTEASKAGSLPFPEMPPSTGPGGIPPAGAELVEAIPAPNSDPEQELLRKERQQALYQALNALEHGEKALFYRKYYYRQSTAQIAAEYGTTQRAIEGRLYRIRQRLRKQLGGDFDDG